MPAPLLSLRDIRFAYRALPVLDIPRWEFGADQQWACLGPNGAGKTTLAGLLSRQLRRASGELQRGPALAQGGIAYVCFEQQKALWDRDNQMDDSEARGDAQDPGTTVAQMLGVAAGRNIEDEPPATAQTTGAAARPSWIERLGIPRIRLGVPRSPLQRRPAQWIDRLGIRHILGRGIRFISTGEMRKTLLLRAILSRPALLILDSPLDGLDRHSQGEMAAIINELLQSRLRVLLLCRRLEDVPTGVSHVLALDRGRVVAQGAREDVLARRDVQALMAPPLPALSALPAPLAPPAPQTPHQPLVVLRGVNVRYGAVEVLRDVDWTLGRGQHCAISGPNGCGKTTLLSLINGDNHKAYGQDITLFGRKRGSGESVWDIKQQFGLLDTTLQLRHANRMGGMTALDVVVSGFFDTIGLYDNWGSRQRQAAGQWLAALGMGEIGPAPFGTLSFGMQRMALLARAVVKSPAILMLDEPCLGLDGHHTRVILRAVDHIAAHSNTQVLFVSHSAGEIPQCINQWLTFEPTDAGFRVRVSEQLANGEQNKGSFSGTL